MNSNYTKYFIKIINRQSYVLIRLAKGIVLGFCMILDSTFIFAAPISNGHRKEINIKLCSLSEIIKNTKEDKTALDDLITSCYEELENQTTEASIKDDWNKIIELTYKIIELKEYILGIRNSYNTESGIGIALNKAFGQYPVIQTVVSGLGADKAGIRQNDFIININNQDTKQIETNKILALIKGKDKTFVTITIARNGIVRTKKIQRNRLFRDNNINLSNFWRENMRLYHSHSKLGYLDKILGILPVTIKSYIDKHGENNLIVINLLSDKARVLSLIDRFDESLQTINSALVIQKSLDNQDNQIEYDLYSLQFEIARSIRNNKLAEAALEKSFFIYESLSGPISKTHSFSMLNNINIFVNSGFCRANFIKKLSCLEYAKKSVDISLNSFGGLSKEYASALYAYGLQLSIAGEVKKKIVIDKLLINIIEQENLMTGNIRLAILNLHASSYDSDLNKSQSELIYRKALNYAINHFGISSIESFKQRLELAEHLSSIYKTRESIEEVQIIIKESDLLLFPAKILNSPDTIKLEEIRLKAIGQLLNLLIEQRADYKKINNVENILIKLNQKYMNEHSIGTATAPGFINIDIYKKNYSSALTRINKYLAQVIAYSKSNDLYKEFKESPIIHNEMKQRAIAGIYEEKAALQTVLNDYKGSLESIKVSIKIRQALSKSNPSELAQVGFLFYKAGYIEINLGHLDSAKIYAEKSIALSKQYKSELGTYVEADGYKLLGVIDILMNNFVSGAQRLSTYLENEYLNTFNRLWLMSSFQKKLALSASDSDHHLLFYNYGNKDILNKIALQAKINLYALAKEIELIQKLLLSSSNSEDYKRLIQLREKLNTLQIEPDKKKEIGIAADELEAKIMHGLEIKRREFLSVKQISDSLPKNAYLIEFKKYYSYPSLTKTYAPDKRIAKYVGYIVNFDGNVTRVDLGNADKIDSEIRIAVAATSENQSDAGMRWHKVSKSVLKPFINLIKPGAELFIAPDSELSNIPFAALEVPKKNNQYLADFVRLRLINSGRDLVENKNDDVQQNPAIVIANPKFNTLDEVSDKDNSLDPVATSKRSASNGRWTQLPSSEIEGQKVAEILEVKLISGVDASTNKIKMMNSPRILHIASHGSFGDLSSNSSVSDFKSNKLLQPNGAKIPAGNLQDPYIVLAGANTPENLADNDDGILSLAETVGLNLRGTELVVLSACNTSSGKLNTGDGVFGLQRALSLAGARSSLLSLWKVDDAATAEFMMRFYKRLKAGDGRSDALAAVQKEFRDGAIPAWKHPYYWAAWQLVGDWKPINGI